VGGGDWRECQRRVAEAMNPEGCARSSSGGGGGGAGGPQQRHAPVGGSSKIGAAPPACPEFPEFLPPLPARLLAIENFYYTAAALSLPARADLAALEAAGGRFCAREWADTRASWEAAGAGLAGDAAATHASHGRYLWRYCFGSAMVWTLLHDVLRVPRGAPLVFANALPRPRGGAEVGLDWALGAALCTLMECTHSGQGHGQGQGPPSGGGGGDQAGGVGALEGALEGADEGEIGAGGAGGWPRAIGTVRLVLLAAALTGACTLAAAAALRRRWQARPGGSGAGRRGSSAAGAARPLAANGSAAAGAAGLPPRGRTPGLNGGARFGSRRQLALMVGSPDQSEGGD
jgi:apyrase